MTDFNPPSDPFADSTWGKAPQPAPGTTPAGGAGGPGGHGEAPTYIFQTAAPEPVGYPRQSLAVTALALSVLGYFCCGIPSLIGMIMGRLDINAIEAGQTDPHNLTLAQAAFIVGLIAVLLFTAVLLFFVALGVAAQVGEPPPPAPVTP